MYLCIFSHILYEVGWNCSKIRPYKLWLLWILSKIIFSLWLTSLGWWPWSFSPPLEPGAPWPAPSGGFLPLHTPWFPRPLRCTQCHTPTAATPRWMRLYRAVVPSSWTCSHQGHPTKTDPWSWTWLQGCLHQRRTRCKSRHSDVRIS